MAFNSNMTQPTNNTEWKATAFLNIWMPQADGTRRKVGAIALKDSKPFEKAVIERLTKGGDDALTAFMNAVEIDFHRADAVTPVTSVGF